MMADSTRLTGVQQDALWAFARDFYARPGVAGRLLFLQDEAGMDVCVLLWRLWLCERGLMPAACAERDLDGLHAWQRDYTRPLRERRRWLKPAAASDPALARLRQTLKDAELQAEKQALARLQAMACRPGGVVKANAGEPVSWLAPGMAPTPAQREALEALAEGLEACGAQSR